MVNIDLLVLLLVLTFTNLTIFQFENILAIYVEGPILKKSADNVGYIFALRAGTYAAMSLVTPFLAKKFKKKYVILTGICLVFFANSFLGSARYFHLPQTLAPVCIGMVLLGISANMVFVCFMPELVDICTNKTGEKNNDLLNDKISGVFGAFFCLGFFFAPIYSGIVNQLVSFRVSCTSSAGIDIIIAIVYALMFIVFRSRFDKLMPQE